jgi:tRNA pseudouridine32 synthase/23S rRNA pseudouridine746 synthase
VPHTREPFTLIHVDADLILVRKPDLLLTVPGRHPVNRDCLITRLQVLFPEVLLVHRLDLDTSGILVFARHREAQAALSRAFQERRVRKHYTALVDGRVAADRGRIDLPIARDWERRPLQKICFETGKAACTHYEVLERRDDCTRLLLQPVTGRSHQLRIHCRELGHPILGCDMYAPNEVLGRAPRLMLHATRLALPHPRSGRELVGHSPPPF